VRACACACVRLLCARQWYIMKELSACARLVDLPAAMAANTARRRLLREYPIKPYAAPLPVRAPPCNPRRPANTHG
jgi:hypothetical protein